MKMKIVLLVLHIVCAVLFGVNAVMTTDMLRAILSTINSVLWGVCIGVDIVRLICDI